jgi:hypothetical protein
MTTIVTTASDSYAVMLGDQGITSDLIHPNMNKITKSGTWLIGVCGEDRICDVLQYAVSYPAVPPSLVNKPTDEWYAWMVKQVIPKIAVAVESSLHKAYRGTIGESEVILISHGHAFLIGETLGITKAEPYWAIGSGSHLAMGALAVDKSAADWNKNHASKARVAIGVAQLHDPYTRGNITGYRSDRSGKITKI